MLFSRLRRSARLLRLPVAIRKNLQRVLFGAGVWATCLVLEPASPPSMASSTASPPAVSTFPVFPGAQGFGAQTPAGRGGKIIKVTNLNDSGPGSLRAAVDNSEPRIIVFEVGGTIALKKALKIADPFLTLAGQTAPSPGITLKGAGIVVLTHDVLIQHLRIRVGGALEGPKPESRDGLRISGRKGRAGNVVCDHLSISWAVDENVSVINGAGDITISNSIISEALKKSIHPEDHHSMAILIREDSRNISLLANLLAHNKGRNPRITGGAWVVGVNNVMYNCARNRWFHLDLGRGDKPHLASIVGNVFIDGPNATSYSWPIWVDATCLPGTKVYHHDNRASGRILMNNTSFEVEVSSPPVWHSSIRPKPSSTVESWTLSRAGARPADRDEVDWRIVEEVKTRTGTGIASVSKAGDWPNLPRTSRIFKIPPRPHGDDDGDGYTNIEEVLHRMAREVEGEGTPGII